MSYLDGRRSVFPEGGVDSFLELYNLPPSQKQNAKRFQELKTKESLTSAEQEEFNSLTTILQHYIIDVETWNKFADAIINVENFFLNETVGYINNLQNETTTFVNTKKTEITSYADAKQLEYQKEINKFTTRGEWQPDTQYYEKNIVTIGGEGFIAKVNNINQPPPNATCWSKIAQKGEKGDPSLNISYKGEYDSSKAYALGDAVTYGGLWYYANQSTIGNPPTDATYWELQNNQIVVSDVEPFDKRITSWIDISM